MATIHKLDDGKRRPMWLLQFINLSNERKTIRLGRIGEDNAKSFLNRFHDLLSFKAVNRQPDRLTSMWLANLSNDLYGKLAKHGLVESRVPDVTEPTAPKLDEWIKRFLQQRTDLKPSSRKLYERAGAQLKAFFKADRHIDSITRAEAVDWRGWLACHHDPVKNVRRKLSEASVRRECRHAKALFNEAVDQELIVRNPFGKLVSTAIAAERTKYVTLDETEKVLDKCPDIQWKALFGLARLGGLRVPSETHTLTWGDIDFDNHRMVVRSVKTERFEKHATRIVPLVPKLQTLLEEALNKTPDGTVPVITLSRNNLRRNVRKIIERSGIVPWEDIFQTLRRSCETDWAAKHPAHVAAAWIGHSEAVSRKHYLMVTEGDFKRATLPDTADKNGKNDAEGALQTGAAEPARIDANQDEPSPDDAID